MNIFLFELWNDATKTIRLPVLDFYAVIVDDGEARNNVEKCRACNPIIKY